MLTIVRIRVKLGFMFLVSQQVLCNYCTISISLKVRRPVSFSRIWYMQLQTLMQSLLINIFCNGGVLEDVFGLEDVLKDTFLKSLSFASKAKALASKPTSLRKCLVLSRGLFFDLLKMSQGHELFLSLSWRTPETLKILRFVFAKTFFFENICASCFWSLALSIPVLGLEKNLPRKVDFFP